MCSQVFIQQSASFGTQVNISQNVASRATGSTAAQCHQRLPWKEKNEKMLTSHRVGDVHNEGNHATGKADDRWEPVQWIVRRVLCDTGKCWDLAKPHKTQGHSRCAGPSKCRRNQVMRSTGSIDDPMHALGGKNCCHSQL